jgi:hypothetical protein
MFFGLILILRKKAISKDEVLVTFLMYKIPYKILFYAEVKKGKN